MMTRNQCRAARALLELSQADLARLAGVGLSTVRDLETGWRVISADMLERLRAALEKAGVELIDDENGGGVGVRLRKRGRGRPRRVAP